MSQPGIRKPDPTPTSVSAPFWNAARERKLMLQHCVDCERAVFYPRLRCPHCWGNALTWVEASGRGTVASYTIIHRPGHPAFAADAPYVVALVDLAEGVRILSNIVNCPIETVQVEMPVNVVWEAQGEFTLPKFQPADSEEG